LRHEVIKLLELQGTDLDVIVFHCIVNRAPRGTGAHRSIPPGRSFDEVIEEALGAEKCLVVLWSKNSASTMN